MTSRAGVVLEHHMERNRALLASTVIQSLLNPLAYLGAMGLGLGSLIDERTDPATLGAPSYLAFVAPALVVATTMQTAISLTAWPVLGAVKWEKTFHAIVSTPARVGDLVVGFLGWIGLRFLLTGAVYVLVMALFDVPESWTVVFVPVVAAVTGLAFAAPMAAFSATQRTDATFPLILRFVVLPLFFFGGVFFPISDLPAALELVARVTPLWQGVAASRSLTLGTADVAEVLARLAYLATFAAAGAVAMRRTVTVRIGQ